MWSKKIKFSLGGLIILAAGLFIVSQVQAKALLPYTLEVPIGQTTSVSSEAEYIDTVYQFLIGIAGIVATIMIMFGGWQWIFAGGNETIIGSAKERITSAIIGLVLALASYLILFTINPALVELTSLTPNYIKPLSGCVDEEDASVGLGGSCEKDCQCGEAIKDYEGTIVRATCNNNVCGIRGQMQCATKLVDLTGVIMNGVDYSAANSCAAGYECGMKGDGMIAVNQDTSDYTADYFILNWTCVEKGEQDTSSEDLDYYYRYTSSSTQGSFGYCLYNRAYLSGFCYDDLTEFAKYASKKYEREHKK